MAEADSLGRSVNGVRTIGDPQGRPRLVGQAVWISGPAVRADLTGEVLMGEQVEVGSDRLIGEIIGVSDRQALIQVYEETDGMRPEEPVFGTGLPMSVTLGPGLIGSVFDGIQRPLNVLAGKGPYVEKGVKAAPVNATTRWRFVPAKSGGTTVRGGELLGTIQETPVIEHRILTPPGLEGTLTIATEGDYTLSSVVAVIGREGEETPITMFQRWPVKRPRPIRNISAP